MKTPCRIIGTDTTVEVAPGERYTDAPPEIAPQYGIFRWVPAGDGTYRPRIQVLETWIRVADAPKYGIHILRDTLVRLGNAGFIGISQATPGQNHIHLESLIDHVEACKDPEFWNAERRAKYSAALQRFRCA